MDGLPMTIWDFTGTWEMGVQPAVNPTKISQIFNCGYYLENDIVNRQLFY